MRKHTRWAPSDVVIRNPRSVALSWSAPTNNGGSPVTGDRWPSPAFSSVPLFFIANHVVQDTSCPMTTETTLTSPTTGYFRSSHVVVLPPASFTQDLQQRHLLRLHRRAALPPCFGSPPCALHLFTQWLYNNRCRVQAGGQVHSLRRLRGECDRPLPGPGIRMDPRSER